MTIEALYPELCSLYGEQGNLRYLQACLPEAQFIRTTGNQMPRFATDHVPMIYLGAMPDPMLELALGRLAPYKDALWNAIEGGTVVLATGNSMELFGQSIGEGSRSIPALGFFSYSAVMDTSARHNSLFLGNFEGMEVVGCKSQFSRTEGPVTPPFLQVVKGFGSDLKSRQEGIHYKNFFGTHLLGPLLIQNPPFTRYLLELLGVGRPLPFEQEVTEAYAYRLKEFHDPKAKMLLHE